eukprot:SAG31_NODE_930_length_10920_cov_4.478329_10_plen_72_part_00
MGQRPLKLAFAVPPPPPTRPSALTWTKEVPALTSIFIYYLEVVPAVIIFVVWGVHQGFCNLCAVIQIEKGR